MICFELFINNKRTSRAGIPGFAVLNASLTWVNHRPRPGGRAHDPSLTIRLGGLDSNGPDWEQGTHVDWISEKLKPGDTVKVCILDADKADPPAMSDPSANKAQLDAMTKKSRRHYLGHYRRQRRELDKQIRRLEAESKPKKGSQ
jgi:hypothetical protein